nr:hypothetical protein [Rickettsia massiliae]
MEDVTTYARSDIKTNELRNIIGGCETAHGKYHSTSYSGQVVGGYKLSMERNFICTDGRNQAY